MQKLEKMIDRFTELLTDGRFYAGLVLLGFGTHSWKFPLAAWGIVAAVWMTKMVHDFTVAGR